MEQGLVGDMTLSMFECSEISKLELIKSYKTNFFLTSFFSFWLAWLEKSEI